MSVSPVLLLFFLSGTAALIYELVWFHLVQLVVGASSLSVAALLASFMGGMALGSALLPRVVSVRPHPLRVVATIELAIAMVGIAMPFVLPFIQSGYLTIVGYGYAGVLVRAAACTTALLVPTMLMGATLPAVARWTDATAEGASRVGLFYMANIAGGAFGTILAGFYLLRVYDTATATWVAATLNVIAAGVAWRLAARTRYAPVTPKDPADDDQPSTRVPGPRLAYLVAGLSGLTALGAEVVWTRQLSLLFGASVYTFSLILAVFLGGLGLGSFVGSRLAQRHHTSSALAWSQLLLVIAIAYAAWAIVTVLPAYQETQHFLPWVRSSPALSFMYDALRCAAALLPATILWGASFPLALATVTGSGDPARAVAGVNAFNTLGSLLGAIGFTLIAIPQWGSQHSQQLLALMAAVSATVMFAATPRTPRRTAIAAAALAGVVAVALWIVPPIPGALIAYGRSVDSWNTIAAFLYLEEGATASVAVTEGTGGAKQFHIAGKVEASDMDVDMRLERMLGHVPALLHPHPKKILVVGVGAGVTAGSFTVHPEVERIVICEIEPVVPASARAYFSAENHQVFEDPRTELVFDDARHFLQTTTEKFDIITSDPIHPWVRGAATLYSVEYLELVKQHLNPGGVVTQWVPLYETDERSVKSQIATFVQVFPDTTLWNPDLLEEGYDLVVLGRADDAPIDEAAIGERLDRSAELRASLRQVTLDSARAVLSTYAGRGSDLTPWLAGAEINRERHLRLQYLAGLAANTDYRYAIFQGLLKYRRYPDGLFDASPETEAQLRRWYLP